MADDKPAHKQENNSVLVTINSETPFSKRRDCWFCGEPNQDVFTLTPPNYQQDKTSQTVKPFSLPSCRECCNVAKKSVQQAKTQFEYYSIWTIKAAVKRYLLHQYRKDLAIGVNWTQAELAESEFEQGNFAGFQQSAWFMFEVAKKRVNYDSWPLMVDGVALVNECQLECFSFDGVLYPSLIQAIEHYSQAFSLNNEYFKSVVYTLGSDNFAKAVRFCRLQVNSSQHERQLAYRKLKKEVLLAKV